MRKNKRLTPKERAFVRAKIDNPTGSTAAAMRKAGYSEGTVRGSSKVAVPKRTAGFLRDALERAGLTDGFLARRLFELCTATKIDRATRDGRFTDHAEDPDNAVQRSALELAARLRGDLVDRHEVEVSENPYIAFVKAETERLAKGGK